MQREMYQAILGSAWVVIVCVAVFAAGMTSALAIAGVAAIALVPVLVMRRLWRDPPETMSEVIRDARR